MEKRIKYNNGTEDVWEKQYVDVYKIVFPEFVTDSEPEFLEKLLFCLGNLYRKFKNGVYQIDLIGKWNTDDRDLIANMKELYDKSRVEGLTSKEADELEAYQDQYLNTNLQKYL